MTATPRKISEMPPATVIADADLLPIVDVSESAISSKNKKVTVAQILASLPDGAITSAKIADGAIVASLPDGAITSAKIADGAIVDADVNAAAAIVDTKLATIATAGKISNSATTATNANTPSAIVARDGSGNFSAGTITAALAGNASTVTTNANLTGDVTSVGNATSIAAGVVVDADVSASAGIVASKLSFTQAGTGAVARTVDSKLKDAVSVKDFGAVGDGNTDDTAAIQAAINSGSETEAKIIYFPGGPYKYSTLTINRPVILQGAGRRTRLITNNASSNKITVTTQFSVQFRDLTLAQSVTQVGGAYIVFDGGGVIENAASTIHNVVFSSCYEGVRANNINALKLVNSYFADYKNIGVIFQNDIVNDSGDHSFYGNTWDAGTNNTAIAISQINSGGLRLVSNKLLGGAIHYKGAYEQTGPGAGNTSVLVICNNSFENAKTASIAFDAVSPATFSYVTIAGNEFAVSASSTSGITINDPGYDFLHTVDISANAFVLANSCKAINLTRVNTLSIGSNAIRGNGSSETGITFNSNCSDVLLNEQAFSQGVDTQYAGLSSVTRLRQIRPFVETGTASGTASIVFGSLYAASVSVTLSEAFHNIIPIVNVRASTGGGAIGCSIGALTPTGFTLLIFSVVNGGAVLAQWTASAADT